MKPIQKPVRQKREKQAGKQPHFERKDRKSAVNSDIKSTPKAKVAKPSRQSTVEGEKLQKVLARARQSSGNDMLVLIGSLLSILKFDSSFDQFHDLIYSKVFHRNHILQSLLIF